MCCEKLVSCVFSVQISEIVCWIKNKLAYSEVAFCSLVLAFAVSVRKLESEALNLTTLVYFPLFFFQWKRSCRLFGGSEKTGPR